MTSAPLTLNLSIDCPLVAADIPSQRIIEIEITVPHPPRSERRAPLNLSLVLDRSGSMSGGKLEYIKQAACHVLDLLDDRDRAAVVAYDETVNRVASAKPLTFKRRRDVKQRIAALQPGGQTNLSGGWLQGANDVAESQMTDGVNRTLLLTDGLANVGITDPEQLAHHAAELKRRGISTSTFGVGLGFDEHLLQAMAERGGGSFYFIEHPNHIPDIFRRELGEMLTVVAREACLMLSLPPGVAVQLLGDLPHEYHDGQLRIPLGDLSANQRPTYYLQILTPPSTIGSRVSIGCDVTYADLNNRIVTLTGSADLIYRSLVEASAAPQDEPLQRRCAVVRMATAETQALKLDRAGLRAEAGAVYQQAMVVNAPMLSEAMVEESERLRLQLAEGLAEPERKARHAEAYRHRNVGRK